MNKYRLVQTVEGRMVVSEFIDDDVFAAMKVRGFEFVRLNENRRHRPELYGQPVFAGVHGPMWDGDAIRYECAETNAALSL